MMEVDARYLSIEEVALLFNRSAMQASRILKTHPEVRSRYIVVDGYARRVYRAEDIEQLRQTIRSKRSDTNDGQN